jgi:hypothetical protein
MVRPYQMNNLYFNKNGNYVASTGYAQIRTKQNSMYIYQYLHFQKFVDKVIERCTGTSYPAINSTDLSNIEINFAIIKGTNPHRQFPHFLRRKNKPYTDRNNKNGGVEKGIVAEDVCIEVHGRAPIHEPI